MDISMAQVIISVILGLVTILIIANIDNDEE